MPALCDREVWVLEKLVLARESEHTWYADYVTLDQETLDVYLGHYPYENSLELLIELGLVEIGKGYLTNGLRFRITADGFTAINEATENNQRWLNDNANIALSTALALLSIGIGAMAGIGATTLSSLTGFGISLCASTFIAAATILVTAQIGISMRKHQHPLECHGPCHWERGFPSMSRYDPLWEHLRTDGRGKFSMSFDEIKNVLGFEIGNSFRGHKKEATAYGYRVKKISLKGKTVEFSKVN